MLASINRLYWIPQSLEKAFQNVSDNQYNQLNNVLCGVRSGLKIATLQCNTRQRHSILKAGGNVLHYTKDYCIRTRKILTTRLLNMHSTMIKCSSKCILILDLLNVISIQIHKNFGVWDRRKNQVWCIINFSSFSLILAWLVLQGSS